MSVNRRNFLKGMSAAALVLGFDPAQRRWITTAEAAAGCPSFDDAPALDGALLVDLESREVVSTDKGNLIFQTPCAVLRPGSVADISAMVGYCRRHKIPVSVRGLAHTTYGQGLSEGLVIENRALQKIHSVGSDGALVDTGVGWKDLLEVAFDHSPPLTPPALTGYTQLTVGGTLSVGGVGGLSGATTSGMQIDRVQSLEVVTGKGDVLTCSLGENRDLFEAVLGGLGQCGVMTKAKLDLVPAKQRARTYAFHYRTTTGEIVRFFADFRVLLDRAGLNHVYMLSPGDSEVLELQATVFYDPPQVPDDVALSGGLSLPPQSIQDVGYVEYVEQIDHVIDVFRQTVEWDRLVKPWFDVWLPSSTIEPYVAKVVPNLSAEDLGSTGFLLVFPQRRSRLTRPLLRVPEPDGSDWVFLFDILTASNSPDPGEEFKTAMRDRNNRLFQDARDNFGGVRYPIGTLDFTPDDWRDHFGDVWTRFRAAKARFDPAGILAPGPGIFV